MGPEEQTGWGGFSLTSGVDTINVSVVTLDEFWKRISYPFIDVLKIDTEGADTWVLQGASQLLAENRIKHIFFEENKERMQILGISSKEAIHLLLSCGYRIKKIGKMEWYAAIKT